MVVVQITGFGETITYTGIDDQYVASGEGAVRARVPGWGSKQSACAVCDKDQAGQIMGNELVPIRRCVLYLETEKRHTSGIPGLSLQESNATYFSIDQMDKHGEMAKIYFSHVLCIRRYPARAITYKLAPLL